VADFVISGTEPSVSVDRVLYLLLLGSELDNTSIPAQGHTQPPI
jgi:hypothetical protein